MPQLTLEYTDNIQQKVDFSEVFREMHAVLFDVGGIPLENCKSRAIKRSDYFIGKGESDGAFIHIDMAFLAGRPLELKQEIGRRVLQILEKCYSPFLSAHNLQITVEIRELARELYFKIPEGTL